MKNVRFHFAHPIKGRAFLTLLPAGTAGVSFQLDVDTGDSNELIIPMENYPEGKWKLVLEWEYEDRYFMHSREFDWPDNNLFSTAKFASADLRTCRNGLYAPLKYAAADLNGGSKKLGVLLLFYRHRLIHFVVKKVFTYFSRQDINADNQYHPAVIS